MAERPDASRALRVIEGLAALLAAGVLVTGVLLAVLDLAAPALIAGSGLSSAQGPRPDRILVPLIVGGLGEAARHHRGRLDPRWRVTVAVGVVIICLAALWWGWWR